jgi:group II intron reverse transcriptase/maturase
VYIAKPDGGQRALGIPTIKDRVVQMAAGLVLGPIFEADLQPEQHAYRPGRSALEAVRQVHALMNTGHTEVIEADLSSYFDTIPHRELMKSVLRRVSDRHMLRLIKMWLEAPVEEIDDRGRHHRTTRNKDEHRGIPQGAPISPLLSNLYMRRFISGWKVLGHQRRLRAEIVNYADDFVILCRGTSEGAMVEMREMMKRLKLTVNEAKTRICRLPGESFEFLSYEFGRCYSQQTGRMYLGTRPSRKEVQSLCREISKATSRRRTLLDVRTIVREINRQTVGWSNYFCLGPVSKAYAAVDRHACRRLRRWLGAKHKVRGQGTSRFPDAYFYKELRLTRLGARTRSFPWATA